MKEAFAYRLKNARIMHGISVNVLTQKLRVSKQMISKYENGMSMPDGKKLVELANLLGVKPDYFFTPATVSLDDIKFRKKAKTSITKVNSVKISILNKMENYLLIEDILSIVSDFDNPLEGNRIDSIDDIEGIAHQLRSKWNIGNDPISNIISLLESKGIKVVEIDEPVEHSFDGLSTFVNDRFPAIVVNRNYPVERKRFTLLHELGHLLLNMNESFSEKDEEKICDRFAGAILLPKDTVIEEVGPNRTNISLNELINIQKRFGVSIPAIMYRLVSLHIFPESKIQSFYMKINAQNDLKVEAYKERFAGDEKSERFQRLVYKALSEEIISVSKASSLLGIDVQTVQDLLALV